MTCSVARLSVPASRVTRLGCEPALKCPNTSSAIKEARSSATVLRDGRWSVSNSHGASAALTSNANHWDFFGSASRPSSQPPRMTLPSSHLASVRKAWSPPCNGLRPEVRWNPFFSIPAMNKRITETVCGRMAAVPAATALYHAWSGAIRGFIQTSTCPAYTKRPTSSTKLRWVTMPPF